jgi:glycosyltransferase involved in cell wall biosynthesis
LRIAFLTELFHPHVGGCERRFLEIGKRLISRGHKVHVFTKCFHYSLRRRELVDGIVVHRYAYSRNYVSGNGFRSLGGVLKYSLATLAKLAGENFDVYYSNEWPMLHSLLAKPVASPLVQEWCEVWTDSRMMAILQRLLMKSGDYHVAVSEFTRQRLLSQLRLDPSRVAVVPNGVDYQKFSNDSNRKVWGRIIYVGRLAPHKHVEMLIDAFCKVKAKVQEAELHIVGTGQSFSSIKERSSRIADCFIHGFLPEDQMIQLLRSAWLFVLPSEREGSGIALLEAMAAGLPFVTVNYHDNATKQLASFRCGMVADPTEDGLAFEILRVMRNDELWRELSINSSAFARRHDWETAADRMEDLLEAVADSDD